MNAEVNAAVAASPIVSVLARIEVVLADLPCLGEDERWRGRVADEAALLFALLEGCFYPPRASSVGPSIPHGFEPTGVGLPAKLGAGDSVTVNARSLVVLRGPVTGS